MPRYDNGEPVTKERIQDEEWYPDYQEVMQFICQNPSKSVEEAYEYFVGISSNANEARRDPHGRFLRWIVLHVERNKTLAKRSSLIEGYSYYRANTAEKDALNSTSYTQELQCLARQVAEHMTDEELEAYLGAVRVLEAYLKEHDEPR